MKRNLNAKLLNDKGLSLVELIMAMGLSTLVSLGVMKVQQNGYSDLKKVEQKMAKTLMQEQLNRTLQNFQYNPSAFEPNNLCEIEFPDRVSYHDEVIFEINRPVAKSGGAYKVTSMQIIQQNQTSCKLVVHVQHMQVSQESMNHSQILSFVIPKANIETDELWQTASQENFIYRNSLVRLGEGDSDEIYAQAGLDIAISDEILPKWPSESSLINSTFSIKPEKSIFQIGQSHLFQIDDCLHLRPNKEDTSSDSKFCASEFKLGNWVYHSLDHNYLSLGSENQYQGNEQFIFSLGSNHQMSGGYKFAIGKNLTSSPLEIQSGNEVQFVPTHNNIMIGENLKIQANNSMLMGFGQNAINQSIQTKDNHFKGVFPDGFRFFKSDEEIASYAGHEKRALFISSEGNLGLGKDLDSATEDEFKTPGKPKLYVNGEVIVTGDLWINGQQVNTYQEDTGWQDLNLITTENEDESALACDNSPPQYRILNDVVYFKGCIEPMLVDNNNNNADENAFSKPNAITYTDEWQTMIAADSDYCIFEYIDGDNGYIFKISKKGSAQKCYLSNTRMHL